MPSTSDSCTDLQSASIAHADTPADAQSVAIVCAHRHSNIGTNGHREAVAVANNSNANRVSPADIHRTHRALANT